MAALKPWQRETKWIWASGVASKELRRIAIRSGLTATPKTLAKFFEHDAWRGSVVTLQRRPFDDWREVTIEVRHPSGAVARLRPGGFEDGEAFVENLIRLASDERKAA